jgi:hypothetical protein
MTAKKKSNAKPPRCEGWRRRGGAFTLGPVSWEQCKADAVALLTVKQDGEVSTLPGCFQCWDECSATGILKKAELLLKPDRRGWFQYPKEPDKVGNFVEDLTLIQRLCGSIMYEWEKRGAVFYVRRVT